MPLVTIRRPSLRFSRSLVRRRSWQQYLRDFRSLARAGRLTVQGLTERDTILLRNASADPEWSERVCKRVEEVLFPFREAMAAAGYPWPGGLSYARTMGMMPAVMLTRTERGEEFRLAIPYEPSLYAALKEQIPKAHRHFDFASKLFFISLCEHGSLQWLCSRYGWRIDTAAQERINALKNNFSQSYSYERVPLALPLKNTLRSFQTVGVDYCMRAQRSWLCDDMGLGKTVQAMATAVGLARFPILVICPKSLCYNWRSEFNTWTSLRAVVVNNAAGKLSHGSERSRFLHRLRLLLVSGQVDVIITNYDSLPKLFFKDKAAIRTNGLEKLFRGVIVDECHEVKNPQTRRFRMVKQVISHMSYRQLLTGTPIVNKATDAAAQLDLLGYLQHFGGYEGFARRYGQTTAQDFNAGHGELNERLRSLCFIRREKYQVLHELPEKVRNVIRVPLTNRAEYQRAEERLARQAEGRPGGRGGMLPQIMELSRLSVAGKLLPFVQWLSYQISQGESVVVFCWHLESIARLREHFPDLLEVSGEVADERVQQNVVDFQQKRNPLIVITYQRGGAGLTLTAARHVAFLEQGWSSKDQDQAEDRCNRIGQRNQVQCHYFLGEGSVDEYKYKLIERKRRLVEDSIDARNGVVSRDGGVQQELIDYFRRKQGGLQATAL